MQGTRDVTSELQKRTDIQDVDQVLMVNPVTKEPMYLEVKDLAAASALRISVETVDQLSSVGAPFRFVNVTDPVRGGTFSFRDTLPPGQSVDNGIVFAASVAGYWVRQFSGGVNIKFFGAVGDGITDDFDAIQNAINSSSEIYIPKGQFLLSQRIALQSGNHIFGEGLGSKLICSENFINTDSEDSSVFLIKNCQNVKVEKTFIDANIRARNGFFILQSKTVFIENCVIERASRFGIYLRDAESSIISKNLINHTGRPTAPLVTNAIYIHGTLSRASFDIKILHNYIFDVLHDVPGADADGIQIQGAVTVTDPDPDNLDDVSNAAWAVLIDGNSIINTATRAIKIQESNVTAINNYCENTGGIRPVGSSKKLVNLNVSFNTFINVRDVLSPGGSLVQNSIFMGNNVRGCHNFIQPSSGGGMRNCVVRDNVVYDARLAGITSSGTGIFENVQIENNKFIKTGGDFDGSNPDNRRALTLYNIAKNIIVRGNLFNMNNNLAAVRVHSGATSIIMEDNDVTNSFTAQRYLIDSPNLSFFRSIDPLSVTRGDASIPTGSTQININHGIEIGTTSGAFRVANSTMLGRSLKINVLPKNIPENSVTWAITNITATQFRVTLSGDPGSGGFEFVWEARFEPR